MSGPRQQQWARVGAKGVRVLRKTACVLVVSLLLLAGCSARPGVQSSPTGRPVFDSLRWKDSPEHQRPVDLAFEVQDRNLTRSMSMQEVSALLGPHDVEAVPADYTRGSASVGYQLAGGGVLMIHFWDGVATRAEVQGRK